MMKAQSAAKARSFVIIAAFVSVTSGSSPMSDRNARLHALQKALSERILVLDGGMGTMIQSYKLEEEDYRGERFADWPSDVKGNNDLLILSRPDVIGAIESLPGCRRRHSRDQHLQRHPVSQADYGMESLAYELNVEGARLARQRADAKTLETPERPRFVAGVLARPAAPARFPRTSTTPATATSPSTSW